VPGGDVTVAGAPAGAVWKGLVLAFAAAILYGIYIPTMKELQKDHPVPVTSAYAKIGSAVCFLVLAAASGTFQFGLTRAAWAAVGALTIFSTVLPSVFFLMGLIRLGAVRTAIVSTVEPFLTAVLGAIVLAQAVSLNVMGGGAMIVAAVVLLQFRRERVA
jgi:drug/metabolite transporter (DMT)-like permease